MKPTKSIPLLNLGRGSSAASVRMRARGPGRCFAVHENMALTWSVFGLYAYALSLTHVAVVAITATMLNGAITLNAQYGDPCHNA